MVEQKQILKNIFSVLCILCVYTYTCVASEVRAFCCSKYWILNIYLGSLG